MKRLMALALAALVATSSFVPALAAGPTPTTRSYPDVTFSGPYSEQVFAGRWNLLPCDLTVSYTLDMSEAPAPGASAVTQVEVGLRDNSGGFRGGLAAFYKSAGATPDKFDLNDKLVLVVPDGYGESGYNAIAPDTIVAPYGGDLIDTYGFWFDRGPTSADQSQLWGYDKITNTAGKYEVTLTFHAISPTLATEWSTVNGAEPVFYLKGWHNGPPVPGQDISPAGRSLTGAFTGVRVQAVMAAGQGGSGPSYIRNIQVTGCPLGPG